VHFFDGRTMKPIAKTIVGVPSQVGGVVGSAASDGHTLYGPHTIGGYLWALNESTHRIRWVSPVGDGVHWGPPVTLANHVLYTVDLTGFLDAYDAATGVPLMHQPLQVGSDVATVTNPPLSWGGVTVARHEVFASVGLGLTSAGLPSMPDGFVIAYAPLHLSP
jgi:outer membrane protein assembly factor BamB